MPSASDRTAAADAGADEGAPGGSRGDVLVVDDEPTIGEVVSLYLERAGYTTRRAGDGAQALRMAREARPDLVVLDVMLPEIDGIEVMRLLHEEPGAPVPVILLTARAEENDRLVGLRRGADDYVVKPFSPAELVARADAVLRRVERAAAPDADGPAGGIMHGGLRIDPNTRGVTVDGVAVALTALEFDLLHFLARRPGWVYTRDQLMESVWGHTFYTDTSTVTVHIRRLRAKLERDPRHPEMIETVWGVGYRLRP